MTDTEAEFRKKDRDYFNLIGRDVICRNQVLPIIAFQWLRFGAGHLFTLGLPDGREMGAQRDEFYLLPTLGDLLQVLTEVYDSGAMGGEWPSLGADAVMEMLRSPE